jgi:hypothetical protein
MFVAALFVGLVACSKTSTPSGTSAPTASATTAPSATTAAPVTSASSGVAHCRTSDLSASVATNGAAAGTAYDDLTLTNHSSAPCTMSGYPGVSLVDSSGNAIGQPASRNASHPTVLVTLAANGSAYSLLGFPNPGNFPTGKCSTSQSADLRVYPPGNTQSLLVPLKETYCPGFSVAALSATKG